MKNERGRDFMPKIKINKNSGFTLIELLVVISVIGFLASSSMVLLNSARLKARDARRKADLTQITKALDLYYDQTNHYPIDASSGGWWASCWIGGGGNWFPDSGNYNWNANIIAKQPHDPIDTCVWPWDGANPTPSATFAYWSDNGQRYALAARLENGSDKSAIQNNDVSWFDGHPLAGYYGWYGRTYVLIRQ